MSYHSFRCVLCAILLMLLFNNRAVAVVTDAMTTAPADIMTSILSQSLGTTVEADVAVKSWVNMSVLGFAAREVSEVWIIGNAMYQSAPEYAKKNKTILLLASVSAGTFLISVGVTGTVVVAALSQFVQIPVVKNIIEALEGVTYLLGYSALHNMAMDIAAQAHRTALRLKEEHSVTGDTPIESTVQTENSNKNIEMTEQNIFADGSQLQLIGNEEESDLIAKKIRNFTYTAAVTLFINQFREGVETGLLAGLSVFSSEEDASLNERVGTAALSVAIAIVATSAVIGGLGFGIKKCVSAKNAKKAALGGLVVGAVGAYGCAVALLGKAGHAFAEVLGIDHPVGDLTGDDPDSIWSEKRLPMSIPNAFFGYDANPDPFQLICMGFASLRLTMGSYLTIKRVNSEETEVKRQKKILDSRKILLVEEVPDDGLNLTCRVKFMDGKTTEGTIKLPQQMAICNDDIALELDD